jgi:hypothetical protein
MSQQHEQTSRQVSEGCNSVRMPVATTRLLVDQMPRSVPFEIGTVRLRRQRCSHTLATVLHAEVAHGMARVRPVGTSLEVRQEGELTHRVGVNLVGVVGHGRCAVRHGVRQEVPQVRGRPPRRGVVAR